MTDVGGDRHGPVIYWVDMNGLRAFSTTPRECEKVLATYVKVPSASYVSDLESRLEKAEAERDQLVEQQRAACDDMLAARNDILAGAQSYLRRLPSFGDGKWAANHLEALKSPS